MRLIVRVFLTVLFGMILAGSGMLVGYRFNPFPVTLEGNIAFERAPDPQLPTLQWFALGAEQDVEIFDRLRMYYAEHEDMLRTFFGESNPTRLKALFVMYIVHISHPYGRVDHPATTLLGYSRDQTTSHCLWFSTWQQVINVHLDLTSRIVDLPSLVHGWVEVRIDGHWEIFDSTSDLWIDQPANVLLTGAIRHFRQFYLRPSGEQDPYPSVYVLSREMLGLGIFIGKGEQVACTTCQILQNTNARAIVTLKEVETER